MSNTKILLLFFGMTLVTYIPRALPVVLIDKMKFSAKVEKFLKLIPYTAMAALIFPGVFTVDTAHPVIGIVGALTASILAWKKQPVMVCVLAAIGADFLLYLSYNTIKLQNPQANCSACGFLLSNLILNHGDGFV